MEPPFKKQRGAEGQLASTDGQASTAALWFLIRTIDSQEPGLVAMIKAVVEAPPPGAVFRVCGAGTVKCNGWYTPFGTMNFKPHYWKVRLCVGRSPPCVSPTGLWWCQSCGWQTAAQ